MDLGAYVQISDLQAVADANGISIHRLREPVSGDVRRDKTETDRDR